VRLELKNGRLGGMHTGCKPQRRGAGPGANVVCARRVTFFSLCSTSTAPTASPCLWSAQLGYVPQELLCTDSDDVEPGEEECAQ